MRLWTSWDTKGISPIPLSACRISASLASPQGGSLLADVTKVLVAEGDRAHACADRRCFLLRPRNPQDNGLLIHWRGDLPKSKWSLFRSLGQGASIDALMQVKKDQWHLKLKGAHRRTLGLRQNGSWLEVSNCHPTTKES